MKQYSHFNELTRIKDSSLHERSSLFNVKSALRWIRNGLGISKFFWKKIPFKYKTSKKLGAKSYKLLLIKRAKSFGFFSHA